MCIAADRLTTRLRQKSFETIMKQDMSFFDEPHNSVSILTGRLAIDTTEVNQVRYKENILYTVIMIYKEYDIVYNNMINTITGTHCK